MEKKCTLEREVEISGIGIHSGKKVNLHLIPSDSGHIVFRRTDLGNLEIPLDWRKIEAKNSSCLVFSEGRIQTVEHLLAVLYILGIDSLMIALDGSEIPILDGSALPFVKYILEAGRKVLGQRKKLIVIKKRKIIKEEEAYVAFRPHPELKITYYIQFDHPVINSQELSLVLDEQTFKKEIAPARTFGFLRDVPELRARGLALGGSLKNAIVLDEKGVINGPLHFSDEFVRHKMLDFIGDLAL
ncbi:MAG: UDP-3-O-acyl-N-acetylglucosamine deacetylase, partial [Candidatus Aminicenantales bacterium]